MRALYLLLLLLLAGCSQPVTKVDGATEATFKESVEALRKPMSPKERKRFERGIQALGKHSGSSVPGAPTREVLNALDGKTPAEVIAAGDADHTKRIIEVKERLAVSQETISRYEAKGEAALKNFADIIDDIRKGIARDEQLLKELESEQGE